MKQPSRRSLLAGTASAFALGAAGCLGRAPAADDSQPDPPTDSSADGLPSGLAAAFEYVFPQDGAGPLQVRITRPQTSGDSSRVGLHPTLTDVGEPDWIVYVTSQPRESPQGGAVAVGSFDVDGDADRYAPEGSRAGFDRYRIESDAGDGRAGRDDAPERVVASDGETLLLGTSSWVEATLDRRAAGDEPYLAGRDGARALLDVLEFPGTTTLVDGADGIASSFERTDVDATALPALLAIEYSRTTDTITYSMAGWYAETPGSSNVAALETFLSSQLSMDDPTVQIEEASQVVVVEGTRPYTPPEERPETAGVPRFAEYDEAAGEVLFRFEQGEQLPVDRYELEIDDEVYDGDWARGQERIGEGDVVAVDADAIEPGDDFSISYESPDGSFGSSTGTSALGRLPFVVDYDPDAATATIRYAEGPPLPADRLSLVVGEDESVRHPWDGRLAEGDTATVGDLPMNSHLRIEYERSDGETATIGTAGLSAPGHFDFTYDGVAETLTVLYPDRDTEREDRPGRPHRPLPDQEPLPASRYEIRIEGQPAARQWTERGEQIAPGDSLELDGVSVGTSVSVQWIAEDGERHDVGGIYTRPKVEFEYAYDPDSDELTITHAEGQSIDPDRLTVQIRHPDERTVQWDASSPISAGDEFVLEDVSENVFVMVRYGERHLDHVHVGELLSDDG